MKLTIDKLYLGQKASISKTISESDVYLFAGITGDLNPIHVNEIYASKTFFKKRVVHGMLVASLISTTIARHLPGEGSIYIGQNVSFVKPVYFGDTIIATVEVIKIVTSKNRIHLKTVCTNQMGVIVIKGEAIISPPTN